MYEIAVIDVLIPFLHIAVKKIVNSRLLLTMWMQRGMWIQSFIVSANSFGKTLIIRASLRLVAKGE